MVTSIGAFARLEHETRRGGGVRQFILGQHTTTEGSTNIYGAERTEAQCLQRSGALRRRKCLLQEAAAALVAHPQMAQPAAGNESAANMEDGCLYRLPAHDLQI